MLGCPLPLPDSSSGAAPRKTKRTQQKRPPELVNDRYVPLLLATSRGRFLSGEVENEQHRSGAAEEQIAAGPTLLSAPPAGAGGRREMVLLHLVAATKLQLLAVGHGGHGAGQLLVALLGPFVLKLPISRYMPRALGDVVFSCRLFIFRLGRILLQDGGAAGVGGGGGGGGRWGRALRLVSGRLDESRRTRATPPDEASLHVVSMLAL